MINIKTLTKDLRQIRELKKLQQFANLDPPFMCFFKKIFSVSNRHKKQDSLYRGAIRVSFRYTGKSSWIKEISCILTLINNRGIGIWTKTKGCLHLTSSWTLMTSFLKTNVLMQSVINRCANRVSDDSFLAVLFNVHLVGSSTWHVDLLDAYNPSGCNPNIFSTLVMWSCGA